MGYRYYETRYEDAVLGQGNAGDYYITAAKNSHNAVNNILATKGEAVEGNKELTALYTAENTDTDVKTYAVDSYSGEEISNLFGEAAGDFTRLTRNDWTGTFPEHDGEASSFKSGWGNEINGTDENGNPASFVYVKEATAEEIAMMDSTDSLSPVDRDSLSDEAVFGKKNNVSLIDLRGKDFDDEEWDTLLDELTEEDYQTLINESGYGTPTHMDPYQMIEAGADGKLNYANPYELDFSDPAVYHYSREAAHHILYTVANSKIMNGAMPGSTLSGTPTAAMMRVILTVIPALLIALIVFLSIRKRNKEKANA